MRGKHILIAFSGVLLLIFSLLLLVVILFSEEEDGGHDLSYGGCKRISGSAGTQAHVREVRKRIRHRGLYQCAACNHTGRIRRYAGGRYAVLGIYGLAAKHVKYRGIHQIGVQVFFFPAGICKSKGL